MQIYTQHIRYSILFSIVLFGITSNLFSATITATGDGNWSQASTWAVFRTGTISTDIASTTVTGTGTLFTTELSVSDNIYNSNGDLIGVVASITSDTELELNAVAASTNTDIPYKEGTSTPANGDLIIIPTGITVTVPTGGNLTNASFGGIQITGDLVIEDNLVFSLWEGDSVIVKPGGKVHIGSNITFSVGNVNLYITVENGGEMYIGGQIDQTASHPDRRINNYGYIEIDGSIESIDGKIFNYSTGVMLIHGNIKGNNDLELHNYGIITIDQELILTKTKLYNYDTGKLIVFGTLEQQQGSPVVNSGLIQAVNYIFYEQANLLDNTNGTIIVQDLFTVIGSQCPGCPDKLGEFFYGALSIPSTGCTGYTSCEDFILTDGNTITLGRRLWLSSTFIGYGQSLDGDKIDKWFDLANTYGFKMSQSTESQQPSIQNNATNNINFNYLVNFSGNNIVMDMSDEPVYIPSDDNGMAIIGVVVPASSGSTDQAVFDFGLYNTDGYGFMYSDDNIRTYTATNHGGVENAVVGHSYGTTPTIVTQITDILDNQKLYINSAEVDNQSITLPELTATEVAFNTTPIGTAGPFTLGASSADISQYVFDGSIAELIIYAHLPSAAVINSTESFLALKYGITKPTDYTDYFGNTVYSTSTYGNGVIGIAREDLNLLNQKQSRSIHTNQVLTIGINPTFVAYDQREISTQIAANSSYFICGHDGNATPADRIYKLQTTNFTQEVTLQFAIAGLTPPYPQLVIDDNDAFSSANTEVGTYADDKLTVSYTFPSGTSYFKLENLTPLPQIPGVGINTETIDATAELHIVSTNKGILLPALADETAITEPAVEGLIFYNTTHKRFMYYDGSNWKFVGEPLKQDNATLTGSSGSYTGEIRYNTTTQTMWVWSGATWLELKNN